MYKYCHYTSSEIATQNKSVNLHDCRATQISLKENTLSFSFPEGFWISQNNRLFYTDEGKANFLLLYPTASSVIIYIFTQKDEKIIREEYNIKEFIQLINEKSYNLEFLYSYIGYQTFRFDCWLWFEKEPYHKECELIISAENAFYQWNNMYEEKSN